MQGLGGLLGVTDTSDLVSLGHLSRSAWSEMVHAARDLGICELYRAIVVSDHGASIGAHVYYSQPANLKLVAISRSHCAIVMITHSIWGISVGKIVPFHPNKRVDTAFIYEKDFVAV